MRSLPHTRPQTTETCRLASKLVRWGDCVGKRGELLHEAKKPPSEASREIRFAYYGEHEGRRTNLLYLGRSALNLLGMPSLSPGSRGAFPKGSNKRSIRAASPRWRCSLFLADGAPKPEADPAPRARGFLTRRGRIKWGNKSFKKARGRNPDPILFSCYWRSPCWVVLILYRYVRGLGAVSNMERWIPVGDLDHLRRRHPARRSPAAVMRFANPRVHRKPDDYHPLIRSCVLRVCSDTAWQDFRVDGGSRGGRGMPTISCPFDSGSSIRPCFFLKWRLCVMAYPWC